MTDERNFPPEFRSLIAFISDRFEVIPLALANCPAHFCVAVPKPTTPNTRRHSDDEWSDDRTRLPPALRSDKVRVTCGRGITRQQALVSCLGETAELLSACFWGTEPTIFARLDDLGSRAIHPNRLLLISDDQYNNRDEWNAVHGQYEQIPERFDERQLIQWVQAFSPIDGKGVYIPAAYAYVGFSDRLATGEFSVGDTNGCASASSADRAAVTGFLELVERDASAIWWYGRHRRPAVDPRSLDDPELSELLDRHSRCGRIHHLLDITTDLGIPVLAAISADADGKAVALGFGAHFSARTAALAAVTEMLQIEISITAYRLRTRERRETAVGCWLETVDLANNPQLRPNGTPCQCPKGDRFASTLSPADQLERCIANCEAQGLQLLTLDLTRPEIGVPATRVIVPGLRHYRARFAPGRLFDVPLALKWGNRAIAESDLNPTPLII